MLDVQEEHLEYVIDFLKDQKNEKQKGFNYSATFAVLCSGDATYSWKTTDGNSESFDMSTSGHALAITDITSNTVTFANPWDSSEHFEVTWSEFANIGIGELSYVIF